MQIIGGEQGNKPENRSEEEIMPERIIYMDKKGDD